jgi:adenylate cyclase class 2
MQTTSDHEIEIKFYLHDLPAMIEKIKALGAQLAQERVYEHNYRFDTPAGELIRKRQVLRLRQDEHTTLTFKGPASIFHGVSARPEFEFTLNDAAMALKFLDALGYQVVMIYEKYRAVYEFDGQRIMLDEMPFGTFLEIEGPSPETIKALAEQLGLNWERSVSESYNEIFQRIKRAFLLSFRDMTFDSFKDVDVDFASLDILPADKA